jgi:hypothetical protein
MGPMAKLPRGIAPELLVSQVRNTMPYLFEPECGEAALGKSPAAQVLRAFEASPPAALSHFEYFRLCLCSHYLTCATPVPTDVDNQIRHKLWPQALPLETAIEMANFVLDTRRWDFTLLSSRCVHGKTGTPWEKEPLSGHLGEWFTVASGAYCALRRRPEPEAASLASQILDQVSDETHRHSEIFGSLMNGGEGLRALEAAAAIAHNFGDLDRVMDMWELEAGDPMRLKFYKLCASPYDADRKLRYLGRLWIAGELYKSPIGGSAMAFENHRHFALRKPRCLRQSAGLRIPAGPFFDDWGRRVGALENEDDITDVVDALRHGWQRLPRTVGYGRALRGILERHPGLADDLRETHESRAILDLTQERFEAAWNRQALEHLDEIPSRA